MPGKRLSFDQGNTRDQSQADGEISTHPCERALNQIVSLISRRKP
jgi:hypothetical protein